MKETCYSELQVAGQKSLHYNFNVVVWYEKNVMLSADTMAVEMFWNLFTSCKLNISYYVLSQIIV